MLIQLSLDCHYDLSSPISRAFVSPFLRVPVSRALMPHAPAALPACPHDLGGRFWSFQDYYRRQHDADWCPIVYLLIVTSSLVVFITNTITIAITITIL